MSQSSLSSTRSSRCTLKHHEEQFSSVFAHVSVKRYLPRYYLF